MSRPARAGPFASASSVLPASSVFPSSSIFASSSAFPSSSSAFPLSSSFAFRSSFSNAAGPVSFSSSSTLIRNSTREAPLPLTTIFTPPASCTELPYTYSESHSGYSTFWRDKSGPDDGRHSACYPSNFRPQPPSAIQADYSPGVCPSGYAAASSAENQIRGAWMSWCCPSGMSYGQDYGCYSTVSTSTVVNLNSRTSLTMLEPFVAVDWPIKVAWATSQLDLFTPASAPLLSRTDTPEGSWDGMSNDMRSALQVGIPVSVVTIAVIAVACYALWRRKRRSHRQPSLMTESEKSWYDDGERLRDDSAQPQGSSDATPATNTDSSDSAQQQGSSDDTPMTNADSSGSRCEAEQHFTTVREDSWQFDETEPAVEPS